MSDEITGKEGLSEAEIFASDEDPMEALLALRAAESVEDSNDEDANGTQEESAPEEDDSAPADTDTTSGVDQEDAAESDKDEPVAEAPKTRKFKADGKEYEFTEQEILDQFEGVFGKAVNFTQKTQKMAPYRKMISALEQENISSEQLDMAIDALKGDKGALAKLLKLNEVDPFDLADDEVQKGYTPKQYGKNEHQLDIEEQIARISGDEEYPITVDVIDNQWDPDSRKAFAENPSMIQGLHNDIKSGLYDKVAPMAMKLKVLDGNAKKSDLEYYMLAGAQFTAQQSKNAPVENPNAATQAAESKFDQASSEAKRKRSASSTGIRADRKGVIDLLDDNDEAFDEWYKNLQSKN